VDLIGKYRTMPIDMGTEMDKVLLGRTKGLQELNVSAI
jgi:hypothetical protein